MYEITLRGRPETIPGTRFLDHYGRQTDKYQEFLPMCQKMIYEKAIIVYEVTKTMNNNYMEFIGYETCDRIIWIQVMNTRVQKPQKWTSTTEKFFLRQ